MIGSILFNGNIVREQDFIYQFQHRILQSNHIDPKVRESKKVLLITGAWGENEYNENHVKQALRKIGITSNFSKGYDENIQNLSVYHEWMRFHEEHPAIKEIYFNSLDNLFKIKKFYRERNLTLLQILRKHTKLLRREFADLSMADILSYPVQAEEWRIPQMNDLEILQHYSCREIQKTLGFLNNGDELQAKISSEIQECTKIKSGIVGNPTYQSMRKKLTERILSSNSIFLFGGDVRTLYYSLKFWELDKTLREALLRGTNFYTVSAGSIILCENIIVYHPHEPKEAQNFEFFDNGFGLVKKIKLFPHCRDRIQTDDPHNLAYLAHRFKGRVCVGLNEESFLLLDGQYGPDGRLYPRFTSIGQKDGVYVFDTFGRKHRVDYGQQLLVPGTMVWEEQQNKEVEYQNKHVKYDGETMWSAD